MTTSQSQAGVRQGRAAALIIADQGLNGVTNILVTILVAHSTTLHEFGLFATVQLTVALGQTIATASIGDLWLQGDTATRARRFAGAASLYRRVATAALIISVVLTVALHPSPYLVGLGAIGAITGLDYYRLVMFASDRALTALVMDLLYGGLQIAGIMIWLFASGWRGAFGAWLAWGIAAWIVFGIASLGVLDVHPIVGRRRQARAQDVFSLRYGGEMAAVAGGGQVAQLLVSTQLGVAFNGYFRATQIAFGPLVVLYQASRAVLIPKLKPDGTHGPRRLALLAGAVFLVLACAATGLALAITQVPALRTFIGNIHPTTAFVLETGWIFATLGVYYVCFFYFRAQRDDRRVSVSRVVEILTLVVVTTATFLTRSTVVYLLGTGCVWFLSLSVMLIPRRARTREDPATGAVASSPASARGRGRG